MPLNWRTPNDETLEGRARTGDRAGGADRGYRDRVCGLPQSLQHGAVVKRVSSLFWRLMELCHRSQKSKESQESLAASLGMKLIPFYAGPRDGSHIPYSGLVLRLPAHPEGAYCFDGTRYRWLDAQHRKANKR